MRRGHDPWTLHTVDLQVPRCSVGGTQPAAVLSDVVHLQVLDEEDPPLPIGNVLIAAALRQLLVSFVPGDVCTGFGHLTDELHAVRLCSLHVRQVLGEPRLFLWNGRRTTFWSDSDLMTAHSLLKLNLTKYISPNMSLLDKTISPEKIVFLDSFHLFPANFHLK